VIETKTELAAKLGREKIIDDPATLESYSHDQSFVPSIKPRLVIKPANANEAQAIVNWANQTRTPLVPVSSGAPHFYGDTVPGAPGAAMVDLSGMRRIIHIDRRNRMAMIEAGVTYGQLLPELAKAGLRLPPPLLPRANKSVVASLLERQPTIVPRFQWSILDPLRCIEVIFGDGNMLMTGDAGSHGASLEEEWELGFAQQSPSGPQQIDFYRLVAGAQGSMGIVTWASIKCQVLPQVHKLFIVAGQKLEELLDFAYKVLRFRFGDEFFLINGADLASILGKNEAEIKARRAKLPAWMVITGITGGSVLAEERAAFQEKDIREMAQQLGLELLPAVSGAREGEILEALLRPSGEPYWKLGFKGACQDIFFITTLDKTPQFLKTMYSLMEEAGYPASDAGVYIQPVHQGSSCNCEFSLPYDPGKAAEVTLVKDLFTRASARLMNQGAFFSRPYGMWANMAFNRDARTTATLKKLKEVFDPNHIMNPGKLCF
jgi:FAD/FMN-containing dehydrogenase